MNVAYQLIQSTAIVFYSNIFFVCIFVLFKLIHQVKRVFCYKIETKLSKKFNFKLNNILFHETIINKN